MSDGEVVKNGAAAASTALQALARGVRSRRAHSEEAEVIKTLRHNAETARAVEALTEVPSLRRRGSMLASAVGAGAAFFACDAVAAPALAAAAAAAALSERQAENERHQQSQALTATLQREAIDQERALHRDAVRVDRELHTHAVHEEKILHLKTILTDLMEHDKEADRDLWEQRNMRFQTLMTVSGLLFAGAFALAVEGDLPTEPGDVLLPGCGRVPLATLHYSLLAAAFGLHLCVISGCLCITSLFSEFMDVRLRGQATLSRDMKRYSVLLLGMRRERRDARAVAEAEKRLDDALRRQCVIETSRRRATDDGGEATFAWSLFEWYR